MEENWHVIICPTCKGKGSVVEIEYEEDDGYGDQEWKVDVICQDCSGKKFVKINMDDLNEYGKR